MKHKIFLKYRYIDILVILIIAIVYIWNLGEVKRILTVDEFVYWGVGASISGFDWKDLLATSEYYSFGYSFILVPLFMLVKIGLSMEYALKIAIVFNGVFIALCYFICNKVIDLLFEDEAEWLKKIIAFFVTFYIGNLIHMDIAWAETWLIFVYWFIILMLGRFIESPNYKNGFLLIFMTGYIFTVHMRSLGVVIAVGFVLVLYVLADFKKLKKGLVIFLIADSIIMGLAVGAVKKIIVSNFFSNSEQIVNSVNNVSTNIESTKSLISVSGLVDLMMSMMSKLFYAGSASFLLAMIGAVVAVSFLAKAMVKRINYKEEWQLREWLILFFLLSFLAENGIAAIFKCFKYFSMNATTDLWDTIVFGRYSDFVIGPMMILGVYALLHIKNSKIEITTAVIFYMLCALVVQFQFNVIEYYRVEPAIIFRTLQSIWMRIIYNGSITNFAYYVACISILVFGGLCLGCLIKNKVILSCMLVTISMFWAVCGINHSSEYIQEKISKEKEVATVYEIIDKTEENVPIYQVYDAEWKSSSHMRVLQWMLGERAVYMQNIEYANDIPYNQAIVLCDSNEIEAITELSEQLEYVYNSGAIAMFVSTENPYYRTVKEQAELMQVIANPEICHINLNDVVTEYSYIKMNGDMYYNYSGMGGAYLTENMGVVLNDGIYEFSVDMRVRDCVADNDVGYITVGEMNGEVQHTYPLKADDFIKKERNTIKVSVVIEGYNEPYIGIYTYGEASVRIYDIYYQKICNNVEIDSQEIERLLHIVPTEASLCYIDSDDSAESGFPHHNVYQWSYIGGKMLPYKKHFKEDYYLVEKNKMLKREMLFGIMQVEQETENYILLKN